MEEGKGRTADNDRPPPTNTFFPLCGLCSYGAGRRAGCCIFLVSYVYAPHLPWQVLPSLAWSSFDADGSAP